jgi:hypothetical protein
MSQNQTKRGVIKEQHKTNKIKMKKKKITLCSISVYFPFTDMSSYVIAATYVIKFLPDFRKVCGFLLFLLPIKLTVNYVPYLFTFQKYIFSATLLCPLTLDTGGKVSWLCYLIAVENPGKNIV